MAEGTNGTAEGTKSAAGIRRIAAVPPTATLWAPFGWIPVTDTDPADGAERLTFEWADPHVNVISHAPDEVDHLDDGLVCERMYRHDTHTQVLLALTGPSVIAVAPADVDPSTAEGATTIRAFRLEKLDAVVLHRGTWHWGPFPLGEDPVLLFNVQGLNYARDNASVELGGLGTALVVAPT